MIDWSKGYTATYYMRVVDPITWRDPDPLAEPNRAEIISGSITRNTDALRESASLETSAVQDQIEQWIRIWRDVEQDGDHSHDAIFTGLATTPRNEFEGLFRSDALECYSVLKPADDVHLLRGYYVNEGTNGAEVIKDLLSVTPAPSTIAYSDSEEIPYLEGTLVAEDGETHLTMIEKILTIINWRLVIDGYGNITICPKASEPSAIFDPYEMDILEPQIKMEADWFDVPNVFCAINDDITAIARDDDENSLLSTINRGREVWMTETSPSLADNETIEEYANRRLKEEQILEKKASYNRRYVPEIAPTDLVLLHYPEQNLNGLFMITSQSIDLNHDGKTNEEAVVYG